MFDEHVFSFIALNIEISYKVKKNGLDPKA